MASSSGYIMGLNPVSMERMKLVTSTPIESESMKNSSLATYNFRPEPAKTSVLSENNGKWTYWSFNPNLRQSASVEKGFHQIEAVEKKLSDRVANCNESGMHSIKTQVPPKSCEISSSSSEDLREDTVRAGFDNLFLQSWSSPLNKTSVVESPVNHIERSPEMDLPAATIVPSGDELSYYDVDYIWDSPKGNTSVSSGCNFLDVSEYFTGSNDHDLDNASSQNEEMDYDNESYNAPSYMNPILDSYPKTGQSYTCNDWRPRCIDGSLMSLQLPKGMAPVSHQVLNKDFTTFQNIPETVSYGGYETVPATCNKNQNCSTFNYFRPLTMQPKDQTMPLCLKFAKLESSLSQVQSSETMKAIEMSYRNKAETMELDRFHALNINTAAIYGMKPWSTISQAQQQEINKHFDKKHYALVEETEAQLKNAINNTKNELVSQNAKSGVKTRSRSKKARSRKQANHKSRPAPLNSLAIKIMETWYERNKHDPYPSNDTSQVISRAGGITAEQVKKWFANKRVRSGNTKTVKKMLKKHTRKSVA